MTIWKDAHATVEVVARKWILAVVEKLQKGPLRYTELLRQVDSGLSAKMFGETLRSMEHMGLIHRRLEAGVPPATEYRLTEKGREVAKLMVVLARWWRAYGHHFEQPRELGRRASATPEGSSSSLRPDSW